MGLAAALLPINPLAVHAGAVTEKEIGLVQQWVDVRSRVGYAVWKSVGRSAWGGARVLVWNSLEHSLERDMVDNVANSVWGSVNKDDSAMDSVRVSLWDGVWAYMSSLFPGIAKWQGHPEGVNPFQPCIDLWHAGFVPSFDGKIWRLHAGEKAEIVWSSE